MTTLPSNAEPTPPADDEPGLIALLDEDGDDSEATSTPEVPTGAPAETPPAEASAAPASTPSAPPAATTGPSAPAVTPAPSVDDARERDLQAREQQMAQAQAALAQRQQEAVIAQSIEGYRAQLEATGLPASEVQSLVQQQATREIRVYRETQQLQNERLVMQGQHAAAIYYSKELGVPYADIAQMNTPQEMEAAGKAFKANADSQAQIADLRAKVQALTQAQVPGGQVFDDGSGWAAGSKTRDQRLDELQSKDGQLTDDEHLEMGKLLGIR